MTRQRALPPALKRVLDSILPLPRWDKQRVTPQQRQELIERRALLRDLLRDTRALQKRNMTLLNRVTLLTSQMAVDSSDSLTAARVIARVAEITNRRVTDISLHRPELNDDDLHGLVCQFHAGPMCFTLRPDHSELLVEQKGMRPRPLGCCSAGLTRDGVELLLVFIDQAKHPKRWRKLLPKDLWGQVYVPSPKKEKKKPPTKPSRAVRHALEVTEGWQDES
jgi:hypothetical protein